MKPKEKNPAEPSRTGELMLIPLGLGILAVVAVAVLPSLGPLGETVWGVIGTYVIGFLGLGMLLAVWIDLWRDYRERVERGRE